ncbi:MAG: thioredoxin [Eubacterium sp.]|nr:thioredoxin [Eubacterium sp.]
MDINIENFEQEVINSDKPVLVDFWASWCGPCMMLAPIMEEIEREHDEIKVCKVNVDANPELAEQFGITTIPRVLAFVDGELKDTHIGLADKEYILALLD